MCANTTAFDLAGASLISSTSDEQRVAISSLLHKVGLDTGHSGEPLIDPPDDAITYLHPNNPRLLELREAYAAFGGPANAGGKWDRFYATTDVPLMDFRGDCAFVWQRRDANTPINYVLSAYYILAGEHGHLLRRFHEDGLFGAYVVPVDASLSVSRDVLDSVLEIAFLDKVLGISERWPKTVLDIGAGYGRLAHRLAQAYPTIDVLCADAVPEATFICEYYLRFRGASPRARAVPLHEIEKTLTRTPVDLAVNIHSFSECSFDAVVWWHDVLRRHSMRHILIAPNAGSHGGSQLLSFEAGGQKRDFLRAIEERGYRRIACEPKYRNPVLQQYGGVSPTCYHLFELGPHDSPSPAVSLKPQPSRLNTGGLATVRYTPETVTWLDRGVGYAPASGRTVVLPNDASIPELLMQWRSFASLDEVAVERIGRLNFQRLATELRKRADSGRVARMLSVASEAIARRQLRSCNRSVEFLRLKALLAELASSGALISEADLLACSGAAASTEPETKITVIAVDGRGDSRLLRGRVDRILSRIGRFRPSARIFAINGGGESEPETGEVSCSAAGHSREGQVVELGHPARASLARRLEAAGIPPETARFALFGYDPATEHRGAERNAALLCAAGECLLFVEHTEAAYARAEPGTASLILAANGLEGAGGSRLFDSGEAVTSWEPLGIHERLLGRTLPDLIREHSTTGSVDITLACGHIIESLRRGEGRIGGSLTGYVEPTLGRRCRLFAPSAPTVCHELSDLDDWFALDARSLLPPFLPCGYNDQHVFALLLARCWRDVYFCQLPWGRTRGRRSAERMAGVQEATSAKCVFADLVAACIASASPVSPDPAGRLREIGRVLSDIASMGQARFEETARICLWQHTSNEIAQLEGRLTCSPCDRRTAARLRSQVRTLQGRCLAANFPVFIDVSTGESTAVSMPQVRLLLGRFGELLHWWPEMFSSSLLEAGK
jgi:SAM-dependent methyltransferase